MTFILPEDLDHGIGIGIGNVSHRICAFLTSKKKFMINVASCKDRRYCEYLMEFSWPIHAQALR
jgi:hypothetical protein